MILFLDFDGVLHPNRPDTLFVLVPRLAAWLEAWPQVEVVISSSWRVMHSKQAMTEMLGPVIGSRVVGCTPWAEQTRDENTYSSIKPYVFKHEREHEIEAWIAASGEPDRPWVALDDTAYLFKPDCARLVVCSGTFGLSPENIEALDRHAAQAGLTCASNRQSETLKPDHPQAPGPERVEKFVKHFGSCLPDALFEVTLDRPRRRVTIGCIAFDSYLVGWLVTRVLSEEHDVRAFREDGADWNPPPAAYEVRVRMGGGQGVEFDAEVVRLSSAVGGGVAVRLSGPTQLMAAGA